MKSIILEGIDGTGKSTLALALAEKLGFAIVHAGGPPGSDSEAIRCCVSQQDYIDSGDWILDRVTPISRQCYELHIGDDHRMELQTSLKRMLDDVVVIWCDTNVRHHEVKEHDTEEHIKHIADNHDEIQRNYINMMDSLAERGYAVLHYDYQTDRLDDFLEVVHESVS